MSELTAMPVAVPPVDKFREFLLTKGMRLTPEREAIVDAVYATHEHFDADVWIEKLERRKGGGASRSTVYRTLSLLEEAGLIRETKNRGVFVRAFSVQPLHDFRNPLMGLAAVLFRGASVDGSTHGVVGKVVIRIHALDELAVHKLIQQRKQALLRQV